MRSRLYSSMADDKTLDNATQIETNLPDFNNNNDQINYQQYFNQSETICRSEFGGREMMVGE